MDQLTMCPVCTLYLHSGMSLEEHLDTHPKDQVIRALCSLQTGTKQCTQYGCRSFSVCDCKSERSFRSGSRTPVIDGHRSKMNTPSGVSQTKERPPRTASIISRAPTPAELFRPNETVASGSNFFGIHAERIVTTPLYPVNDTPIYAPQESPVQAPIEISPTFMYSQHNFHTFGTNGGDIFIQEYTATPKPPSTSQSPCIERPYILELLPMTRPGDSSNDQFTIGDTNIKKKGLKIISNIKVEVPISSHSQSDVVDLTSLTDFELNRINYSNSASPFLGKQEESDKDSIRTELCRTPNSLETSKDSFKVLKVYGTRPVTNTFSVIKNIGNPSAVPKSYAGPELEPESILPDLTCNEKRISPCSDLTNDSNCDYDPPCLNVTPDGHHNIKSVTLPVEQESSPIECRSFADISRQSCETAIDETMAVDPYDDSMNVFNRHTDPVRPVNVIAFGNPVTSSPSIGDIYRETPYKDFYNSETTPSFFEVAKKMNECPIIEDKCQYKSEYVGIDLSNRMSTEKDENFDKIECFDKEESIEKEETFEKEESFEKEETFEKEESYDKVESFDKVESLDKEECFEKEESLEKDDHKKELLTDDKSIDDHEVALNIRTDERMPPRGELSGQESNGDMDTPWEGIYHGVTGSTAYDLIARETWTSDASDNEMPIIHCIEQDNDSEEMPIVVSVKPPEKNYKCASCGQSFNCPKERRVHRAKEHPVPSTTANSSKPLQTPRLRMPKQPLKITPLKPVKMIKNEKPTEGDNLMTLTHSELNILATDNAHLGDSSLLNIKISPELPDAACLEPLDRKPKLEAMLNIKEETKKKRDYHCPMCKEYFPTEPLFSQHLKIHPLECLTCGKYFYKRSNLQLHIKRHLGIRHYRCNICEKRFHTRQKMMEHINIHTGENPVKCNLCDETFRRHSNMVQHRNRHHLHIPKKIKDFVCQCGEVFHSKKKLLWHKEIHDDRPKTCQYCPEKFVHISSLTRHIRKAHNNYFVPDEKRKKDNVECAICKQVYFKNTIEMHLRTHSDKKPYSCVICNRSFKVKWNLQLHRWTHANRSSKPFKCSLCKGAFLRHADYVSHMNAHKSVKPYTCNYCGCRFIRKYNCRRHVQEHENEKKFVCDVPDCGKTFHRSYYLADHMKVHSGSRPFACNICGKTSSTKSNHNKHVKIHHAREPVATES